MARFMRRRRIQTATRMATKNTRMAAPMPRATHPMAFHPKTRNSRIAATNRIAGTGLIMAYWEAGREALECGGPGLIRPEIGPLGQAGVAEPAVHAPLRMRDAS